MITFTDAAYGRVMDRLNNARQMVQCARTMPDKRDKLINEAHRILGECAEALKAGVVIPDGPDGPNSEPWAMDDMALADMPVDEAMGRYNERVLKMTREAMDGRR